MTPLTCNEAVKEFFSYLDRALSGEEVADLEEHLDACMSCCDKLAFSRDLDGFIKKKLPDAPPPGGLEARIRQALDRIREE
jgi:mycothiol system anti-sigma-R factor